MLALVFNQPTGAIVVATPTALAAPSPLRPVVYHGLHAFIPQPQHHAMVWNMGTPVKTVIVK